MSTSVVQICNTALARIGVSNFISSIDESSTEAAVCKVLYESVRDRVLREHPWGFASVYTPLALVAEADETASWAEQWDYAYRYPSDALVVRKILSVLGKLEPVAIPYSVGRDAVGRLIFTDEKDAKIEYTSRVEDASQFDPSFASVVAWLLASEIAMPLSALDGIRKQALQMFAMELDVAKRIAANEGEPLRDVDTEFVRSRGYAATGAVGDGLTIFPSGFTIS